MESLEKLNFVQSDIPTRVKMADRLDNLRDAALSGYEKSFVFYKESTLTLLEMSAERRMDGEHCHEELFCLMHGFIQAVFDQHSPENALAAFFQREQDKYMVKATKGQHEPMLYPGPGLGGQGASF